MRKRAVAASWAIRSRLIGRWRSGAGGRAWQCSRVLRPRLAFLVGELRGGTRSYRVGGARAVVRHRSRDLDIVTEIWGPDQSYEPPPSLTGALTRPGLKILDLGANIGLFAVFAFTRWDVAELSSFEPDSHNLVLLHRTRARNGFAGRWTVHERAVANYSGEMEFVSLGSPDSFRPGAGEAADRVAVYDLFTWQQPIDLLKIDIEGGEWPLLQDPRLADLPAEIIVVEWHWRGAPDAAAGRAAAEALRAGGYVIESEIPGHVPGVGMIWARRGSVRR